MNTVLFVIVGITGDLARRKLLPGLLYMIKKRGISTYAVIGVGREAADSDAILANARPFMSSPEDADLTSFRERFVYHALDVRDAAAYTSLRTIIEHTEKQYGLSGNRIFYLAVGSYLFGDITQHMVDAHILLRTTNKIGWQRVVYEKPFGSDSRSAHALNAVLATYLDEQQIYRVDHYLTKELVSAIVLVRATNTIFEPLWNNTYISEIQIVVAEPEGIGQRGAYYDQYGALKDMVQNHMLSLLALIGMEPPAVVRATDIRDARAAVLRSVTVADCVCGQYDGYRGEPSVASGSTTETFVALAVSIDNDRWRGVPIFLKTGKYLARKETVIHLKFKDATCRLINGCPVDANWLTIQIAPDAHWTLTINTKKPGDGDQVVPVAMTFCHDAVFGELPPEQDYATLLEEVVRGEQSVVVGAEEIEQSWRIIEHALQGVNEVHSYARGSEGPDAVQRFEKKHNMRWRS